jgi:hypothetical protein
MSRAEQIEKIARERVLLSGGQLSMEDARTVAENQVNADETTAKADETTAKAEKKKTKPEA